MALPEISHETARMAIFKLASDMEPNEVVRVAVALIAGAIAQSGTPNEEQIAAEIGDLILNTLRRTRNLRTLANAQAAGNA
jgi:hypothetical protein